MVIGAEYVMDGTAMFMDVVGKDKVDPHASMATTGAGTEYSATFAAVPIVPGEVYVTKGAGCSTTVDVIGCSMIVDVTGVALALGGGTGVTVGAV